MTNEEINKKVEEDLQPILDMFSGTDGGAAFVKFRHGFMPDVYKLDTPNARAFKEAIRILSSVSKVMLKGS